MVRWWLHKVICTTLGIVWSLVPAAIGGARDTQPNTGQSSSNSQTPPGIVAKEKLVAWCIVPFDAKQRTPAERAAMIQGLGLKRVAYDWRDQHVPLFESEILEYQKRGIEFFAFWSWHDAIEPLLRKYDLHPQIWMMLVNPAAESQADKVVEAAQQLLPMVEKTKALGCRLGIYNHGGWGGEPHNMAAVCQYLREHSQADHVGIVYNWHHGHEHIDDFEAALQEMLPFLICVNINGMADAETVRAGRDKILSLGTGKHETAMLAILLNSGYRGPVGIIHHREEMDAEIGLRENLTGLERIVSGLTLPESVRK